jgi:large subunit ribosomal protein L29
MKAVELREMTMQELEVREEELTEGLARLRIQLAIKRLDNPLQVRVTRRELARVKTIITEKTLGGEQKKAPEHVEPNEEK